MSGKGNNSQGRKTAYSAVATALSLAMIFLTAFVPVMTVAPLLVTALAWNVVLDKCGVGYGLLTMVATIGLGFLTVLGAGYAVMIIIGVVFVPYSLLAYFIKPLTYDKVWTVAVRLVIMAVFASVALVCLYFTADFIMSYIKLASLMSTLGGGNFAVGYLIVNLIAVAAVIGIDFMYLTLRAYIIKRLK